FGHDSRRRDPADLVAGTFREPYRPVRSGGDGLRLGRRVWKRELRYRADRRDAPDLAYAALVEPQIAIRSGCDMKNATSRGRDRKLRHLSPGEGGPDGEGEEDRGPGQRLYLEHSECGSHFPPPVRG